jgi:hypothetical protein
VKAIVILEVEYIIPDTPEERERTFWTLTSMKKLVATYRPCFRGPTTFGPWE